MKSTILIRADGNPQLGLGHLVRCFALSHMLKDEFEISFYCKELPESLIPEFERSCFGCNRISNEENFFNQLSVNTIVVLDGYHFDSDYQIQIKAKGAKLVCIDDLHDRIYSADLIINHAPGVKTTDYKANPYTQFALGPDYALLRPAFLEHAKNERTIEKIETVLICFGGSDYKNLTEKTLKIVAGFRKFKKIIVVVGSSYQYTDSLNLIVHNDKRITYHHSVDEKQMLSVMLEADLAIVPASGILFEVKAAGCIAISGMYAENQKFVYSNFKQYGSFIDANDFNEFDLKKAIVTSFEMKLKQHKIIDGGSSKRLLKLFLQLDLQKKVKLRMIKNSDVKITYEWAANTMVRAYSFTKHSISEEEHREWFKGKLSDSKCLYLIAEVDSTLVGTIRFDIKGNEAIISYLIGPEYHGKGLGQIILVNGIEYIIDKSKKDNLSLTKVAGYVMQTNIPSIKIFERLGFEKYEEDNKIKFEKLIS